MSADPWLSGLLACALTSDAEAIRHVLHSRGLKTRSVPVGRAKGAWTCVTDRGTLAVVVSGMGAEATRSAAGFWMPRARWLVYAGAGPGTGIAETGTVILDGDPELAVLAARGATQAIKTQQARVAQVAEPILGPAARETLSNSGFAAWDPNVGAWRDAAREMGGVTLVCLGVTTNDPEHERDLLRDIPEGATGRPWWRVATAAMLPKARRQQQAAAGRHAEAIGAAAQCAVAALLGPA